MKFKLSLKSVTAIITCFAVTTVFISCKKEDAKEITAFSFASPPVVGEINESAKTIAIKVPSGTDVTKLTPTITVSEKATVSPASGVAQNFTNPVRYTVTAEDGSTASYTVTVKISDDSGGGTPDKYTAVERQKIDAIKNRYSNIQANFTGGYFITVPTTTPSYTIGKVKTEVLQAGVDALNLMRYIAGIPDDVVLDADYTELNQHGAVLLTAINQLTHTPTQPADMSKEFYDKGYKATSSSNISTSNLPYTTIFQYMDDSDKSNIDRVGHRRWILNPTMKKTGFGVGATKYGLLYAFDKSRGNVDYDYVTWPSQGVFPTEFVTNNHAWSISVNTQKYGKPDISKIEVTLKHVNTGDVWTFSNSTITSTSPLSTYFNIETSGYGISNCIIFRPKLDSLFKYQEDDVFEVTVSGLDKNLSYTVKMFSIKNTKYLL
jgi:hypothetical protein